MSAFETGFAVFSALAVLWNLYFILKTLLEIRDAIRNLQITVNNATPDSRDLDRTVQRAIRRAR